MNAVTKVVGWSIAGMSAMMLIPVGVKTFSWSVFGRRIDYDYEYSLWTVMSNGGFEILFWSVISILALYAFFKWAGTKIRVFPTLMTAGWIIAGSIALLAWMITTEVNPENWKGIDTVIEPAAWTALGFFVFRELIGLVDKIWSKLNPDPFILEEE